MNQLSIGWKIFKVGIVLQLLDVLLHALIALSSFVSSKAMIYSTISIVGFVPVIWFLIMGLTLLNNNYPNHPLSFSQKKTFNRLYLLNFLAIALMFANCYSAWKDVYSLFFVFNLESDTEVWMYLVSYALIPTYLFVFHIIFLAGMYKLRRLLHRNQEKEWDIQFD